MSSGETVPPDERVFRAHVESAAFQSGLDRGRWRPVRVEWPHALIAVAAAPRPGGPAEYVLRFDCRNYPQDAPTARLWDLERDCPLETGRWPGGTGRVSAVFRPEWQNGTCLYLPCDRVSAAGHHDWPAKHPSLTWSPDRDITLYLRAVHDLLHSRDYTGPRQP